MPDVSARAPSVENEDALKLFSRTRWKSAKAEADYSNRPRRREHSENARKRLEVTFNAQFAAFTSLFSDLHVGVVIITTLLSLKGAKVSHYQPIKEIKELAVFNLKCNIESNTIRKKAKSSLGPWGTYSAKRATTSCKPGLFKMWKNYAYLLQRNSRKERSVFVCITCKRPIFRQVKEQANRTRHF